MVTNAKFANKFASGSGQSIQVVQERELMRGLTKSNIDLTQLNKEEEQRPTGLRQLCDILQSKFG